jgi:hypothetical protein
MPLRTREDARYKKPAGAVLSCRLNSDNMQLEAAPFRYRTARFGVHEGIVHSAT